MILPMARHPTNWTRAAFLALGAATLVALSGCSGDRRGEVIVYAAQDQVYAEPILREFTRQTGVRVRSVFDSEAVKTVGLANRLLTEMNHPQADVFWGNEELRTRQLQARGVFRETNGVATFGFRTRRIVINTNRLSLAQAPRSLLELTNRAWRGKVALAYPMFGTTATHFQALRQHWGETGWKTWCRALQANQPFLVKANALEGAAPTGERGLRVDWAKLLQDLDTTTEAMGKIFLR
jgi:iron(III) transport system substrate-binding protein